MHPLIHRGLRLPVSNNVLTHLELGKGQDMPDFIPNAAPVVILVGLIVYFFEVVLPDMLNPKKEVDLEEATKIVVKHKEEVKVLQKDVIETAAKLKADAAKLQEASIADKADTEAKKADVNKSPAAVKEFLQGEGFDVKEIYPE